MDTIARWLLGKKVVKKAKVMHEYKAANPDELTIEVGQIIEILKQVRYASSAVIYAARVVLITRAVDLTR